MKSCGPHSKYHMNGERSYRSVPAVRLHVILAVILEYAGIKFI